MSATLLQEHRSNEEPLPADVAREEAQRINTRSLAFASYYYPDANCLPSTRTVCVARFCEVSSLCAFLMSTLHISLGLAGLHARLIAGNMCCSHLALRQTIQTIVLSNDTSFSSAQAA